MPLHQPLQRGGCGCWLLRLVAALLGPASSADALVASRPVGVNAGSPPLAAWGGPRPALSDLRPLVEPNPTYSPPTQQPEQEQDPKSEAHRIKQVTEEVEEVKESFFKGWRLEGNVMTQNLLCGSITAIWFFLYLKHFFQSDRGESTEPVPQEYLTEATGTRHQDVPDVVLVFHHPTPPEHKRLDDADWPVPERSLERIRVSTRKATLQKRPTYKEDRSADLSSVSDASFRQTSISRPASPDRKIPWITRVGSTTNITALMDTFDGKSGGLSMAEVRTSLLQELYAALPAWGFDVRLATSADNAKLFLCVSLRRKDAIDYHLVTSDTRLQLQQVAIQKLGIDQPKEDDPASSPPLVRYDPQIASRLHDVGLLPSGDPRELYRTYLTAAGEECVVGCADRVRLICRELTERVNLDAACDAGLMVSWYPVHQPHILGPLKAEWASSEKIWDLTFQQPLSRIEGYFGSRVAFAFGWTGIYCKALLALAPPALLCHIFCSMFAEAFTKQILGFSLVLTTWARFASNLWDQEEDYFATFWDVHEEDSLQRPRYRGDLAVSALDANLVERSYPDGLSEWWQLFSAGATLALCGAVAVCIHYWWTFFQGRMASTGVNVLASLILALQITLFEKLYNFVVVSLVELENHKFNSDYFTSLLWKQFIFQSVNNYSAFAYLAIRCRGRKCLEVLQHSVSLTLILLCLLRLAEVVCRTASVQWSLWHAHRQLQRRGLETRGELGPAEEQLTQDRHSTNEQVKGMLQLVLALGYVFLFGAAAPIVVPFCLVVFVVHLRTYAYVLTHKQCRPFPWRTEGVGHWRQAVKVLVSMGVLTSACLLCGWGSSFYDAPPIARVSGFILFCFVHTIIWFSVDAVCPRTCKEVQLLRARRAYVMKALLRTAAVRPAAAEPALAQEVQRAAWGRVPRFDGSLPGQHTRRQQAAFSEEAPPPR